MAKSKRGAEIHELYEKLERLRNVARYENGELNSRKAASKNFKFDPYKYYSYSPCTGYWEECQEDDLRYEEKMYAYVFFFRDALKSTEKEIKRVKKQIKELQRLQSEETVNEN